jgi:hypothetical protein
MNAWLLCCYRRVLLLTAAMPLLAGLAGCETFVLRVAGGVANQLPSTIFNVFLQLVISLLTGTSDFLFQSGGQFGGGFGGGGF